MFKAGNDIAWRFSINPKRADPFFTGCFIGHGHHDRDISMFTTGDELLHAIQDIFIAFFLCRRAQVRCITTGMRFGQTKRAESFSTRERTQPLLFLFCVRIHHADTANRAVVDRNDGRSSTITRSDLFEHQGQRQIIHACATEFFWHSDTIGTHGRQFFQFLSREMVFFIPTRCVWCDALLHKATHGVADHFVF